LNNRPESRGRSKSNGRRGKKALHKDEGPNEEQERSAGRKKGAIPAPSDGRSQELRTAKVFAYENDLNENTITTDCLRIIAGGDASRNP